MRDCTLILPPNMALIPPMHTQRWPLHNGSLKEVQRKEAKRELRSAKENGSPVGVVHSLAKHFSLVRAHSQLKRASRAQLLSRDVRAARLRCHKDFKEVCERAAGWQV